MRSSKQPSTAANDLTAVIVDVLGNLAFMVVEDEPLDPPAGTVWMQGSIDYHGPMEGTVRAWCTRGFAVQLAANLLGLEPRQGEVLVAADDAVCEFLNVLCGQLVTSFYGAQSVFNLSIPEAHESTDRPPDEDPAACTVCRLNIGGEPLVCLHERRS